MWKLLYYSRTRIDVVTSVSLTGLFSLFSLILKFLVNPQQFTVSQFYIKGGNRPNCYYLDVMETVTLCQLCCFYR